MNKINKCDSCNNVYSHRQSLWRHRQNCNNKRIRVDTTPYSNMEISEQKNTTTSQGLENTTAVYGSNPDI